MNPLRKQSFLSDGGFTLAESMASLFLLSIVMILLLRMAVSLPFTFLEDRRNSLGLSRQWILYRLLSEELEKVQPPWWSGEYQVDQEGDQWIFPWYGGEEESCLILEFTDTEWTIQHPENSEENPDGNIRNFTLPPLSNLSTRFFYKDDYYPSFEISSPDIMGSNWVFLLGSSPVTGRETK